MPNLNDSLPAGVPVGTPCLIPESQGRNQPPFVLDRLCILVGTGESADLQLAWEAAPRPQALIVTTRNGVYLHDLTDDASISINGKQVRQKFLRDGDQIQIGKFTLAFAANQAVFVPPAPIQNINVEVDGKRAIPVSSRAAMIGRRADCDIRLRDHSVAPIHAVIFFADQNWHIRDFDSETGTLIDEQKAREGAVGSGQRIQIGSHRLQLSAPTAAARENPAAPATNYGTVPKIKRTAANVHDNGDAPAPPVDDSVQNTGDEIDDFAENRFWEMTDEQQGEVPLPSRPTDLTPAIPPAGTPVDASEITEEPTPIIADPLGEPPAAWNEEGDVFAQAPASPDGSGDNSQPEQSETKERARPARPASPRPAVGLGKPAAARTASQAAPPWVPRRRRSVRQIRAMAGGMVLCMSAAAATIWFVLPSRSTVEGRILFENTPASGSPAWQSFEAQQRTRLADPSTSQAAIAILGKEYSDLQPGFLADAAKFAAVAHDAAFEKLAGDNRYDLVLTVNGADSISGTARLTELLKAFYQADNDLVAAATQARQALTDWRSNFAAKQQQLADLNSRIAEQKNRIADAQAAETQLKGLQTAADRAQDHYASAQTALEGDQADFQKLGNELSLDAPTAAATRPSQDVIYADLQSQIQELSDRIDAARAAGVDKAVPQATQNLLAAEQQLDREFISALDLLKDFPDTVFSLSTARQLHARICQLNDQLIQRQHDTVDRYVKRRMFVEGAARRRQQAAYAGDDQIQQLRAQLAAAVGRLDEAEHAKVPIAEEDRKGLELEISTARSQLSARQVALNVDEDPTLHERLGRLIDDGKTQLRNDRQAVEDTLATLTAQLEATPPMANISSAQRESLQHLMQGVRDLTQAETAFTTTSAQAGPAAQSIVERQDQVNDLKKQADLRRQVLAALPATTQQQRQDLAAQHDAAAARLMDDQKAVVAAHDDFVAKALAGVDAGLTVDEGRVAGQTLLSLETSRDAKSSEIDVLQQDQAGLEQAANSTLYMKPPTQSDVSVVWDDSTRKMIYTLIALAVIGAYFSWLMSREPQSRGTAGRKTSSANPAITV